MILGLACDARRTNLGMHQAAAVSCCIDPLQPVVVRAVTTADGLRSNNVYSCRVDPHGYLWLGTACGVARFAPATGQIVTLDQSQGMPDDDCNSNALHLDTGGQTLGGDRPEGWAS